MRLPSIMSEYFHEVAYLPLQVESRGTGFKTISVSPEHKDYSMVRVCFDAESRKTQLLPARNSEVREVVNFLLKAEVVDIFVTKKEKEDA